MTLTVLLGSCQNQTGVSLPQKVQKSPTAMQYRWNPHPGSRLQIQFSGEKTALLPDVDIYDLDLFDTPVETINAIHFKGGRVLCYLNAGAWEDWRPDALIYPTSLIGKDYSGWPGEKWLDIRQMGTLQGILSRRLDLCKAKGFDGVEPDNLDGFQNPTGFSLTAEDQILFNRQLAESAHARGLAIGLKNDPDQIRELEPYFDFSILEDCFQYGWCEMSSPFLAANKPVFAIEYTDRVDSISTYCPDAQRLGLALLLKHRDLDAYRESCP